MISEKKLDFYITSNLNVLFIGKHGVGKTSAVLKAFDKHGLNYLYLSAATMDPWVDLIGVPQAVDSVDGHKVLDLVRPAYLHNNTIEAIFFDEFNRSHKKIRNACLELIQFKSINARPFSNLRFVWAAINPEDDQGTYDVDRLDPAQKDRFHIFLDIPYTPSEPYFGDKYGKLIGSEVCSYWKTLTETARDLVSPRRLDYATDVVLMGGSAADVLPYEARPADFETVVYTEHAKEKIIKLSNSGDLEPLRTFLATEKKSVSPVATAFNILSNDLALKGTSPALTIDGLTMLIFSLPIEEVKAAWDVGAAALSDSFDKALSNKEGILVKSLREADKTSDIYTVFKSIAGWLKNPPEAASAAPISEDFFSAEELVTYWGDSLKDVVLPSDYRAVLLPYYDELYTGVAVTIPTENGFSYFYDVGVKISNMPVDSTYRRAKFFQTILDHTPGIHKTHGTDVLDAFLTGLFCKPTFVNACRASRQNPLIQNAGWLLYVALNTAMYSSKGVNPSSLQALTTLTQKTWGQAFTPYRWLNQAYFNYLREH